MTTDCAANMLKSTSNLLRCVCFCHRINTIISKVINAAKGHPDFQELILKSQELSEYTNRTDLKFKVTPKIRLGGKTRPWRYYIFLFKDILYHKVNSANLTSLLISNNKYSIVESINQDILSETIQLLEPFKNALGSLEKNSVPTLNKVISFYYLLRKQLKEIQIFYPSGFILKDNLLKNLKLKYKTSFTMFHWIATFLYPIFKNLPFL